MICTWLKVLSNSPVIVHLMEPGPLIVIVVVLEERLTKRGALGFERMHNKGRPWVFDILKSLHR